MFSELEVTTVDVIAMEMMVMDVKMQTRKKLTNYTNDTNIDTNK